VTTLVNATLWLLAAVFAGAVVAALRGASASEALAPLARIARSRPALGVLALVAAAGLGSRIVVGYLAPGAYAEEVLAARGLLAHRSVYGDDDRAAFAEWVQAEPAAATPWELPGLSTCQAGAIRDRPQYFSRQAHTPALLFASVPIVRLLGGRGFYVCLLVASLAALAWSWRAISSAAGLDARSPESLTLGIALLGWQPVLAGVRQGDAVLVAGGLVLGAWTLARKERWWLAGVAAGLAGAVALPALGSVVALVRWPRALAAALATLAGIAAGVVAIAGPMVLVDFWRNAIESTTLYGAMIANYAIVGRSIGAAGAHPWVAALAPTALLAATWMRVRRADVAIAAGALVGVLLAPVAWSQHLVLGAAALAVLFPVARRTPLRLAVWSLLAIALSLPDPAVASISLALQPWARSPWPVVAPAIAALWAWLALPPSRVPR
jgi:hypothetical protein